MTVFRYNGCMQRTVSWWHVLADAGLILLAFLAAHGLRFGTGWIAAPLGAIPLGEWLALALLTLPLWLLTAALHGLYYARLKQAFSAELGAVTHTVAEGLLATILVTFAFRGLPDSRLALLLTVALAWLWLAGWRALARRMRQRNPRAVVIGNSPLAAYLRRQFTGRATRFELAAAFEQASELEPDHADAIFCDTDQAAALWQQLSDTAVRPDVYLLPGGDAAATAGLSVATVEGLPTLAVKSTADLEMMRRIKRVIDITGSLVLIVLTSPLWLLCMLLISGTMPGPLFFSHERLGLNGRTFRLYKFRSMVRDAHSIKVNLAGFDDKYKLKNDPRITPFGRVLRKLSLDELPQLRYEPGRPPAHRHRRGPQVRAVGTPAADRSPRTDRHVAGQRPQRHDLPAARGLRPVLHQQLEPRPRPADPAADHPRRAQPQGRVLTSVGL